MAMTREEYDDERQYQCISKYDKIVNKKSRMTSKRAACGQRTNHIKENTSASNGDHHDNRIRGQVLSHFITNHLHELNKSKQNHELLNGET
ncbi:hypothetical protein CTI12_AA487730 [Artemisia annua]|uniref:Uncharacterized protein n=1 Tax=Artemisia annua TaxID=35608 RepID=A0A2U1LIG5_ARTAN|nr:hypothetical protein CTI12_AA487730 [Artemisia annua]